MAILNSCCCWRSVRRGSYACAMYSLVYYLVLVVLLWEYPQQQSDSVFFTDPDHRRHHHHPVLHHLTVVMLALAMAGLVTCVLLFIGLCKDVKVLLLPWLVDAALVILVDLIFVGWIVYQEHLNMDPAVAITFTIDFFLLVLHIYAMLCVTSQYQEYRDGRGTARDEHCRSPPAIRYTKQSTVNSGVDSTRRTVTFLDHGGFTPNGLSPSHNTVSPPSRSPASVTKELGSRGEDRGQAPAGYLLPSDPSLTPALTYKTARNGKKHVQFPTHTTVSETEPTEVESDAATGATLGECESPTRVGSPPVISTSVALGECDSPHSTVPTSTSREITLSCISTTSRGAEATPLIDPESPDEMKRY
ncbi:uncharacterized protein [Panulirus ornatus]|uniref:uncharacterized protein isoform X2 n=1 Tax=Panulirus ornatus TaxID=150431 RepID=UPI003A853098